jgi:hypothetical protein
VDNLTGSEVISTSSCTVSYDVTYAYPAAGQLTITHAGTVPTCTPALCDATLCAATKSTVGMYAYVADGLNAVTWTSGFNTDLTCTGATPYQDNPVAYSLIKQ